MQAKIFICNNRKDRFCSFLPVLYNKRSGSVKYAHCRNFTAWKYRHQKALHPTIIPHKSFVGNCRQTNGFRRFFSFQCVHPGGLIIMLNIFYIGSLRSFQKVFCCWFQWSLVSGIWNIGSCKIYIFFRKEDKADEMTRSPLFVSFSFFSFMTQE